MVAVWPTTQFQFPDELGQLQFPDRLRLLPVQKIDHCQPLVLAFGYGTIDGPGQPANAGTRLEFPLPNFATTSSLKCQIIA